MGMLFRDFVDLYFEDMGHRLKESTIISKRYICLLYTSTQKNGVTFGSHRSLRQNSYLSLLSLYLWAFSQFSPLLKLVFYIRTNAYKVYY